MNLIAVIILVTIGIDFVLNFWADRLNLQCLRPELPEPFKEIYAPDQYHKSQEYLRVNTRFSWISGSFSAVLLLVFWFAGGFPLLDHWVRAWNLGPILSGIMFIGILGLLKAIVSLPFSVYATFVIEERFGFNKTNWSTYILDLFKGLMLALLLGTPLLAGILFFFEYAGSYAWLFCWLAITLYMLAVQFIAPTWIMPLFNKFTPLEEGELKSAIMEYAKAIQFPVQNVYVMDGSRRSSKSNAFFTGFGKYKRIALFDTLINQHSENELLAVLAHEMGHYKKKHILLRLILGIVQTGLMLYLLSLFISYQGLFDAFYLEHSSVYAGLIFFAMLYSPLDFFMGLVLQVVWRKNETAADRFAVETTGDPQAMADALKKLSAHNLTNLTPHPFYVFLNYSHPPVLERIKRLDM